jgi:hypothetical protein
MKWTSGMKEKLDETLNDQRPDSVSKKPIKFSFNPRIE